MVLQCRRKQDKSLCVCVCGRAQIVLVGYYVCVCGDVCVWVGHSPQLFGLVYLGLTHQQQPGSYRGGHDDDDDDDDGDDDDDDEISVSLVEENGVPGSCMYIIQNNSALPPPLQHHSAGDQVRVDL